MARFLKLRLLILCSVGLAIAPCIHGQEAAPSPEAASQDNAIPEASPPARRKALRRDSASADEIRKRLDQLPPEQREQFRKNMERWEKLSPEQRERMRQRQEIRVREMTQAAQTALQDSGLTLDDAQQKKFIQRYIRERHKIEQTLRDEMEKRRQKLVGAMTQRLAEEFRTTSAQKP